MLEELSIRSLGVIDEARLDLGPGLTVVTGETGAGKTMVVTALGLLLGARADPGVVRSGSSAARVEGRIRVEAGPVTARASDAGADLDDGALILARTVGAEGRSRAHAGGAAVPVSTLAELAADLVVVHGQAGSQRLLQPARQRAVLDAFGGPAHAALVSRYAEVFTRLRQVRRDLDEVVHRRRERAQEADALRYGLHEIEAVDPRRGEDDELAAEELRPAHVDGLRRAADEARAALSADDPTPETPDALSLVAAARKSLDGERAHDPRLDALAEALASASYALADVAADLASYADSLDVDPQRLAAVQERRASLTRLTRKYGDTVADVLAWAATAAPRVLELDDDDFRAEALRSEEARLADTLTEVGTQLSAARRRLAAELSGAVTDELAGLAMPDAAVEVTVTAAPEPAAEGFDDVAFVLTAHEGAPPRPLQKGASGGELSRVMLAVEVCLAGASPVPTLIFDEVDAGVGGRAAVEVGRRLARLARSAQVVVVTHLPQVAAFADRHYVVVKASDGRVTASGVHALDDSGRRGELSRMLAGLEGSEAALAHAEELLSLAVRERAG